MNECRIVGQSIGPQPPWPNDRSLETVCKLHEVNTERTLRAGGNISPFAALVPQDGFVVESGCGRGVMADNFHAERPDVRIIGVSAHDIDPENLKSMHAAYYGILPYNLQLLKDYKGRIDLIVDTYGPMSFSQNPVHVLIYYLLLLKGDGVFSSITSKAGKGQSVLGQEETWKKVKVFFKKYFDVDIAIIPSKIQSRVTNKELVTDYIVRFRRSKDLLYIADDYIKFCLLANKEIGQPLAIRVWYKPCSDFTITEKVYPTIAA